MHEIVREEKGLYKRFIGTITSTEYFESVCANHKRSDFEEIRYTINDFSQAEHLEIDAMDLVKSVAQGIGAAHVNDGMLIAFVSSSETIKQLTLKYGAMSDYHCVHFESLALARHWIREELMKRSSAWSPLN